MAHQFKHPHPSKAPSLCAWPPNPALLKIHLIARAVLVPTSIIGLSLLFVVGVQGGKASPYVGGSFLAVSLFFTSAFMIWNCINLGRAKRSRRDRETSARKPGIKCLAFVTSMDALGVLAFLGAYIPIMIDSHQETWVDWDQEPSYYMTYAYGSVAILIALFIHTFLFTTQLAQLFSGVHIRSHQHLLCPHCNYTMTPFPPSSSSSADPEPDSRTLVAPDDVPEPDMLMLGDGDSDSDATPHPCHISMTPGQETGTTFKTPRHSEHQTRASVAVAAQQSSPAADARAQTPSETEANEAGEGERDTLINKPS